MRQLSKPVMRLLKMEQETQHPMDKFNGEKVNLFQHLTEEEQKMVTQMKKEKPATDRHGAKVYYGSDMEMIIRRVMELMKDAK